jgi:hypothetical protein
MVKNCTRLKGWGVIWRCGAKRDTIKAMSSVINVTQRG